MLLAVLGFFAAGVVHVRSFIADDGLSSSVSVPLLLSGALLAVAAGSALAGGRGRSRSEQVEASEPRLQATALSGLQKLVLTFVGYCLLAYLLAIAFKPAPVYAHEGRYFEDEAQTLVLEESEGRQRMVKDRLHGDRVITSLAMPIYVAAIAMLRSASRRAQSVQFNRRLDGAFAPPRRKRSWVRPSLQLHAITGNLLVWSYVFLVPTVAGGIVLVLLDQQPTFYRLIILVIVLAAVLAVYPLKFGWDWIVPARCPRCDGRAYHNRKDKLSEVAYTCRNCGHVEPLGFRGGIGGASVD